MSASAATMRPIALSVVTRMAVGQVSQMTYPERCGICGAGEPVHPNRGLDLRKGVHNHLGNRCMPEALPTAETDLAEARSMTECKPANDIERVLGWARAELDLLLLQRAAIAQRVRVIKDTIVGLTDVFGSHLTDEELRDLLSRLPARRTFRPRRGLTEVCRRILTDSPQPLTARELCRRIQERNPEVLARQKQPRISVTVVLRRLLDYGEVYDKIDETNARTWRWVGPRKSAEVADDSSSSQQRPTPPSGERWPM